MEKTLKDLLRLILPLSKTRRQHLEAYQSYLEPNQAEHAKHLFKRKLIGISYRTLDVNQHYAKSRAYPQADLAKEDKELSKTVSAWNATIERQAEEKAHEEFSRKAQTAIPKLIAPHIVGMDAAKKAAAWQLFSKERFHILLLGDPGTGKTEILRATDQFAPKSSFGLGSGTSGAGLSAAKKGNKLVKGLLPQAHKGIACLDELNLMKTQDRGALLNAMEKGFVTYDKGGTHQQIPAEARILATANPKGDRFVGASIQFLKEQLPFDPALLSRFHLVFFIRRPSKQEFLRITRQVVRDDKQRITAGDVKFIRGYIEHAHNLDVKFDKTLEPMITDAFDDLKSNEDDYLVELSPRLVLGVVRMAKARARMALRQKTTQKDLEEALQVFKKSLPVEPDHIARSRKK